MTLDEYKKLDEVRYKMLLPTIKRWVKIEMAREQSVAEHSHNVGILALSLYDFMQQDVPHNSFERAALMEWAPIHDLDEIETGDIPADFKNAVRAIAGEKVVDEAVDGIMVARAPSYLAHKRGLKDSYPYDLVKIADKLEEIIFNHQYGRDSRAYGAQVDALGLLRQRLLKAEKSHPRYNWNRAREWLSYFLKPVYNFSTPRPDFPRMPDVLGPA